MKKMKKEMKKEMKKMGKQQMMKMPKMEGCAHLEMKRKGKMN